ncbi:PA14 domain-containing protein [Streptomyces sp. TRM 70361]|uniref:PA14 domain-containing protein n=1 Tax=Streptomyces sp. TRM 70361 TaxID=3116553 RepID=UPI002E7B1D47|nr:PA14 domain-containing protein [Streptomyces sp. TRM 70361]MEE1942409.1 PA14 domain-containing protein [Streptomyces sp. TRM 70361]
MNPYRGRPAMFTAAAVLAAVAGGPFVAPSPAAAAVACASPVYKRQIFANTTLSGTPGKTACDAAVNENWGTGAPASGLPRNHFSVRWTVTRDFGSGGPFSLTASSRDGIRVYVDGVRRISLWKNVSTTVSKTVNLTVPAGKHTIRVDYVNWTGHANVKFAYAPRTAASVDKVRPLTPTGVSVAYDAAAGRTRLTWAKSKEMDLAGYRVHRRLKGTAYGSRPLATTTATTYTDTPPPTGETYYYEIRAHDRAGNESAGTADKPVTTPDRTGPAAPTGLTAHGDLHGTVLGWRPVAGAAAYELYERTPAGAYTALKRLTGTSYVHGVGVGERTYAVRAFDPAGNPSAYSASVTTDGVDRTPPAAPLDLRAVPRRSDVLLTWSTPEHPASDELDNGARFTVLRSPGTSLGADAAHPECPDADHPTVRTVGTDRFYSFHCYDTDWEFDTAYTYGVTLTDGEGNESAPSAPATVTTADRVAPRPLTGLTATPRADGMLLRWEAPADDDIASYRGMFGVRQSDGTMRWTGQCPDRADDPLAVLCPHVPDGETYVYAVTAKDVWDNTISPDAPSAATVIATELDTAPPEHTAPSTGPLYRNGGWTASEDASRLG